MESSVGVEVMAAPRVTTLSGRQVQIQLVQNRRLDSGEFVPVGPTMDIMPAISADGGSVDLTLVAALSQVDGNTETAP
jgi:type II secretory pathway component GspD/PulD (secretin)